MNISLIELDRKRALEYVQSVLSEGRTLSVCLLREAPIERASFHTWLPEQTCDEARHQFRTGGKLPPAGDPIYLSSGGVLVPINNTNLQVAHYLWELLKQRENSVLIVEHQLALPSDPWIQRYVPPHGTGLLFWQDEVYFYGDSEAGSEGLEAIIRKSGHCPIGVVTENREHTNTDWSPEFAARNASLLIVGAYDGESYILAEW